MPISVVINTYNAERHLAEVLETVKDFDEVLVCDMESTDSTREIALRYGCRIVTFEKKNYNIVEPAREFAIHQVTHDWVLVVDADELVTPKLKEYLYQLIEKPDCPAGVYIPRLNKFMGVYDRSWSRDYQLRFFIHEKAVWPPFIHAVPQVSGKVERIPYCFHLLHLADETMQQWVLKMNKYTDLEVEKKARKKYGIGAMVWRPIWRFFRAYVLKGGFLMGKRGFINATLTAFYQVVLLSKILENDLRKDERK